ncbi:hypothetical protein [uncultured Porphyromonas sp.]|uniref:hypothetical protein n=1 Tax=uncultured Porphyromonas sp. TaxID=159274 RepID=UPI002619C55E|nr:hypothetical protein [uncultured Porphyromonas sp.]
MSPQQAGGEIAPKGHGLLSRGASQTDEPPLGGTGCAPSLCELPEIVSLRSIA